jgi:hypothetical protein
LRYAELTRNLFVFTSTCFPNDSQKDVANPNSEHEQTDEQHPWEIKTLKCRNDRGMRHGFDEWNFRLSQGEVKMMPSTTMSILKETGAIHEKRYGVQLAMSCKDILSLPHGD